MSYFYFQHPTNDGSAMYNGREHAINFSIEKFLLCVLAGVQGDMLFPDVTMGVSEIKLSSPI